MTSSSSPEHLRIIPGGIYEAHLPLGVLRMTMTKEEVPLPELCDFALRNNARRRFLFVSRVLGRHLPTRPGALLRAARALAEKLPLPTTAGDVVFFGMSETATTLGQAVFAAWCDRGGRGLYIESTRRRTGGEVAFEFVESHSHATAHLIHRPGLPDDPENCFLKARTVVVVDDEATTGRTAAALLAQYAAWRGTAPEDLNGVLAVLVRWSPPEDGPALGLGEVHALAEGTFEFAETGAFAPAPDATLHAETGERARCGARHGVARPQSQPWKVRAVPGEKILVVGTGEFGYQPLLLAAALEEQGATAWVQATTRSPVLPGGAISHARRFPALTGEGYTEFLYNVPDDHPYDRVIVCGEDFTIPRTHPLHQIPRVVMLPPPASA
jgi:hypothetical protein